MYTKVLIYIDLHFIQTSIINQVLLTLHMNTEMQFLKTQFCCNDTIVFQSNSFLYVPFVRLHFVRSIET